MRQRAIEAIRLKAARGEHYSLIAVGYVRAPTGSGMLNKDPYLRVREALALVFRKFDELQSARQVLLWLKQESIEMPTMGYGSEGRSITWKRPTNTRMLQILKNPVYCGAYVFGRTATEVRVKDGRKSTSKVKRNKQDWPVCIWDHHEGYISRETFQRNQQRLAENTNMWGAEVRGSIRRGESLLAGLLRCGHCGRKLSIAYTGSGVTYARYICRGEEDTGATNPCISFGGWRVDQAVAAELLNVISPLGVQAALLAIEACNSQGDDKQRHTELALQQARFEAKHARRQYEAVDPDNRLVASELERRWNECLETVCRLEADLSAAQHDALPPLSQHERQRLLALGADLSQAWDHPMASAETRKRILRTVLKEIVVRVQDGQIQMVLHWEGGDHTAFDSVRARSRTLPTVCGTQRTRSAKGSGNSTVVSPHAPPCQRTFITTVLDSASRSTVISRMSNRSIRLRSFDWVVAERQTRGRSRAKAMIFVLCSSLTTRAF